MANPLINAMPGAAQNTSLAGRQSVPPAQQMNPLQYLGQFMQNPLAALRTSGYSIPDGMNDPRQIANHLISSGQLGRGKLGQLQNMAKLIGKR